MGEIVDGLGAEGRRRAAELIAAGRFFWIDAVIDSGSREALAETLGVDEPGLTALLDFEPGSRPTRRFHADGVHVVFAMSCFAGGEADPPIDVGVLVSGHYVLTLHREGLSLPEQLEVQHPAGRSEQYMVYAVLDAIVGTAYDALNDSELALQEMELSAAVMRDARVRMNRLHEVSGRLADMRRRLGPQRGIFERVAEEIGRVEGLEADSERYFERIRDQLSRLVNSIDAASATLAQVIDLRLNETMYRLTVVATIFLPLTFITGFFGMNFKWMVDRIDTPAAFILLGIGAPLLLAAMTWGFVALRERPVDSGRAGAGD